MRGTSRHAIQLIAGHLQQRHGLVRRQGQRLAHPIIGVDVLLDVER